MNIALKEKISVKRVVAILLLLTIHAKAQQQNVSSLSLGIQQAIDMGLKNRFDVQSRRFNVGLSNSEVSKTKKEWIPEISGVGNMRYSPQLQGTYVPAHFFSPDAMVIALGAKSLAVFGLDLNQAIFRPGITTDTKIAKRNVALSEERVKQDENTIKENIAFAYLNVLLKDLQAKITADEEQRYKEYAEIASGKYKLGTIIENDYLKAKLDYENAKVETQKAQQNYALALDNVKHQINVPAETQLVLTDTLNSQNLTLNGLSSKTDANNRTEIKQLQIQQEINKMQINKTKQNALPSLSFYANYSQQFTYTNLDYSLKQWWTPFNYMGLRLNVPITSNFKNASSIHEQKIKAMQTDLNLKQKISDVNYEIQKTTTELNNSQQNMQITKSNYNLSKQIYENQKQQQQVGSLQYTQLLETNRSLNMAEQNYIKAVYDYLLSNINYQKAIGNF